MTHRIPLAEMHCSGYSAASRALNEDEIAELMPQVPDWNLSEQGGIPRLERVFQFENFVEALAFTNAVAEMAEAEDHHPALLTEWGRVTVYWWTHFVGGVHQNDFIAAARTDRLYGK